MQTFRASDGLAIAYALDDYTDPWKPADTLILIHAAMGSSKRFYAWVPHLARDVRVVRIDMRGHGQTEAPSPAQLDQDRLVTDIVELADHVGARTFHVAGSSAGAIVAEKVAIDHPERVLVARRIRGNGRHQARAPGSEQLGQANRRKGSRRVSARHDRRPRRSEERRAGLCRLVHRGIREDVRTGTRNASCP